VVGFRLLSCGVVSIRCRLGWGSGSRWLSGGVCDCIVAWSRLSCPGPRAGGRVDFAVHEFFFQDRVEGLGGGVVVAATGPAHGRENPTVGHEFRVFGRRVLGASV